MATSAGFGLTVIGVIVTNTHIGMVINTSDVLPTSPTTTPPATDPIRSVGTTAVAAGFPRT